MPALLLSLVILVLVGPLLWRLNPHRSHAYAWLAAAPPLAVAIWQGLQIPAVLAGDAITENYAWAPTLGLALTLRLDALSLFFGLIVAGIGACIAFYTNYYFAEDRQQGYFYLLLFFFMASMLGLVWANDLLSLFVFWEFTSISSYLLIAFKRSDKRAVDGARRALIVTSLGGLAMLGGMVLLGQAIGAYTISTILAQPGLTELPIYPIALLLLLTGAFTKSAQFPFHFWLPGAMAAPTPASAYLHSATMVKAGIYLMARMHPGLGDSPLWFWTIFIVGGCTMAFGAISAIRYHDMKAILAYTTVSALGTMTLLLALPGELAAVAVAVTILAHALYKAPLFLLAGIVDHAMGTRDLRELAGLWRVMPVVAAVALLGAFSMAGMPPTWGFVAKELLLEEFYETFTHGTAFIGAIGYAAAVVMAIFTAGSIFTLVWEAFLRRRAEAAEPAHLHHAPSFWFAMPALLLTVLGAITTFALPLVEPLLVGAGAVIGGEPATKHLKLWHGWTPVFVTSLAILAAGLLLVLVRNVVRRVYTRMPEKLNGVDLYDAIIDAVYRFAYRLTRVIQGGLMGPQISVTLLAAVAVLGYALLQVNPGDMAGYDAYEMPLIHEFLIFAIAIVAAVATVTSKSRLSAIISLGVVGVAVTLFFVFFSAPDLALTQLLIEVLTVILLVLVFFRVKPDAPMLPSESQRLLRYFVAATLGIFGAGIVLVNHFYQVGPSIAPYFVENALPIGQGGNVVNVILVDIRGYDTMGEITVLALAALGGYAVLRSPQLHALRQQLKRVLPARQAAQPVAQHEVAAAPVKEAGHD